MANYHEPEITFAEEAPDDYTPYHALALQMSGKSVRQIAKQFGMSKSAVDRDIQDVRQEYIERKWTEIDEIRKQDLAKLDVAERQVWAIIADLYANYDHRIKAIRSLVTVMERRARLIGLDAAIRVDVTNILRQKAIEHGLDPDEVVRAAEDVLKASQYVEDDAG